MKRWHWHRWTKWSEPREIPNVQYYVVMQERRCVRCNKVDRRRL